MKILVIGGTLFIGRAVVEAAAARQHEVTLFHRGRTNPDLFPALEHIHGNRNYASDFRSLQGRHWDAVIDLPGYEPDVVRLSAERLQQSVAQYVFVSTISVYDYDQLAPASLSATRPDEHAPLRQLTSAAEEESREAAYGRLKVQCEQVVQQVMGVDRSLIVRPGVVVGRHDPTDRFTYWAMRMTRGGEVLAPGDPRQRIQLIDARDLADWMIGRVEQQQMGTFNVTGPQEGIAFGEVLEQCRSAAESDAHLTWVDEEWLIQRGIKPMVDLPLWVPQAKAGWMHLAVDQAMASGLRLRPIKETARDTLQWARTRRPDHAWRVGLDAARERDLLAEWHKH